MFTKLLQVIHGLDSDHLALNLQGYLRKVKLACEVSLTSKTISRCDSASGGDIL